MIGKAMSVVGRNFARDFKNRLGISLRTNQKCSERQSIILALHPPKRETLTKCQSQTYGSEARPRRRGPAL
jgi:hypothetical protein